MRNLYRKLLSNRKGLVDISLEVCSLASGSSGNSIYIASAKKKLLIDAGLSGKKISNRLAQINIEGSQLDAILITHEHQDHIKGAGVLSRRFDLPIYATEKTWAVAEQKLGKITAENRCVMNKAGLEIGDIGIDCFSLPHDAEDPVGYALHSQGRKVAIATDIGCMTQELLGNLAEAELVILEANHDLEMLKTGPYPWSLKRRIMSEQGHLCNDEAGATAVELVKNSVQRILLAHLSKDNNVPELAYLTIKNMLVDAGIDLDVDLKLDFIYRNQVSELFQVV
ncbi:MBL fold metallo-hydrolase [Fuchsiella alkaliacetigena]|uniref:MBL fold metallo-hydrolase n=1 Tax=Fuchsiella alkaliacetigena TaxID=957042 RepID=UPI00200B9924|nr:MBL fold metallo-hydrolase [Fuchsiella alkaliacetigena]MCK8824972.1 MBL fold metallo-hydrolase [Fuchsiella alkaliacetigena]